MPLITTEPTNENVLKGSSAVFTVTTFSESGVSYHWKKNGTTLTDTNNVSGSTTRRLILRRVSAPDAGTYSVIVSNADLSMSSFGAALEVYASTPANPLVQNGGFDWQSLTNSTRPRQTQFGLAAEGSKNVQSGAHDAQLATNPEMSQFLMKVSVVKPDPKASNTATASPVWN